MSGDGSAGDRDAEGTAVAFVDRALHVPAADALVLADLHVGRDATSNVELPLGERADLLDRLDALLGRVEPKLVVVAGDLLHAFDAVPAGVEGTVAAVEDRIADAGADLVVTPGNHDVLVGSVASARRAPEIRLADDATVVAHGHELPEETADRYVIGHEHPAIEIEGRRRPCFLRGPAPASLAADAEVIVLPAFSRFAAGSVVNGLRSGETLSPLVADPDAFRPVVPVPDADETLTFPPLGELRRLL